MPVTLAIRIYVLLIIVNATRTSIFIPIDDSVLPF
jgi:hypothetical protein